MYKTNYPYPKKLVGLICLFVIAASCNNKPADIPLPADAASYAQPKVEPLVFTQPKKISWDTTKKGGLHAVIKPFDINSLPAVSYGDEDFAPLVQPPTQTTFNFNSLPGRPFYLDSLPSKPLDRKKIGGFLGAPVRIKSVLPFPKFGGYLGISTLGAFQGITGKLITAMLKDRAGLMWVATEEGLFRYDGEQVLSFLPRLGSIIGGMVQDNDGNIWLITNEGLGMFNPSTGVGYRFGDIKSKTNDLAMMMKDDLGNIWITNLVSKNIAVINPAKKTYTIVGTRAGLTDSTALGTTQDAANNIWVGTFKGINIINLHTNTIKYFGRADGLGTDTLVGPRRDSSGHIWVGAHSALGGNAMKEIDVAGGTITSYFSPNMQHVNMLYSFISANNRFWLGTSGGIIIVDSRQGMAKFINREQGLSNNIVLSLTQDNSGRIWAGTSNGLNVIEQDGSLVHPLDNAATNTMIEGPDEAIWVGTAHDIRIVDTRKKMIRYFTTQHGLSHNVVQTLNVIDGNIWVTTDGGLDIINQTNKTIEHYGKAEGLANDTVYAITKARNGDLWFTAPSMGIDVISSDKTMIRHLDSSRGLNDNVILDAKEDRHGLMWLATFSGGIDVVDVANGTVKYLSNVPALSSEFNKLLLYDTGGRMWIGTGQGIYVADTKANTLTAITTANGLADNKITSLLEHDGKIYGATDKNVAIITPPGTATKGQWLVEQLANTETLTKEVPGTWATNAITAKGQYLWGDSGVTIINSLASYNYPNPTFITGLQINNEQGNFLQLEKNWPDSIMWADSLNDKNVITSLPFFKKDGIEWDSVSGPYNMPANLHITYDKNYLQFQYVQARTGGRVQPLYKYILLGIDKQWGNETTATFTQNYLNLPPGAYIFKVTSKSPNGKWSEPVAFSFTITPPWWKTWWAYTLYTLLIAFAIWQFIQYRSRKLVSENLLLEEKVKQRTDALQHSLEELKLTQSQLVQSEKMASLGELTAGIAHEIQNPLNFVNNFSEVSIELVDELKGELAKTTLGDEVKESVDALLDDLVQNQQKINYHGKRADSIVKGMLQHSRTGSGKKEPADINAMADEYLRLSYHGLRAKDKTFNAKLETNFDTHLPKLNILVQEVGRALLNLYTNAFYSVMKKKKLVEGDYQPLVSVTTALVGNQVEIRVRDNGLGIPQAVLDKIYNPFFTTKPTGEGTGLGLSLSYEIIAVAHGGTIAVETKEGEFAEFIIRLPV